MILHLGYLDYPSYVATVKFHGLDFPNGIQIRDIDFVVSVFLYDLCPFRMTSEVQC